MLSVSHNYLLFIIIIIVIYYAIYLNSHIHIMITTYIINITISVTLISDAFDYIKSNISCSNIIFKLLFMLA